MLVRVGGPGARVVGGGVVEPGVGVVAEGVGGGVRVLLARRLWAISLGSHRRAVFRIGGGGLLICQQASQPNFLTRGGTQGRSLVCLS